ncbi:MAG: hypothetical protein ACO376_04195 [Gammaproteobacteria bacterium]
MQRILLPIVVLSFLALGWWLAPQLQQHLRGAESITELPGADCRITHADGTIINQWPCTANVNDTTQVTLTLDPADTPPLAVLTIQLRVEGLDETGTPELRFEGDDMYMGETPVFLKRSEFDSELWEGNSSLAICTRERMTWRATVSLSQSGDVTEIPFRFDAVAAATN